jgi:hypothetical protein
MDSQYPCDPRKRRGHHRKATSATSSIQTKEVLITYKQGVDAEDLRTLLEEVKNFEILFITTST